MALTQRRLDLLQERLAEHEKAVRDTADSDRRMYLVLYLVISALSLAGALLEVMDGLASPRPAAQGKSDAWDLARPDLLRRIAPRLRGLASLNVRDQQTCVAASHY